MSESTKTIGEKLRDFFPAAALRWKPQSVTKDGKRALAVAYIVARDVMQRLDDAVGVENWQDDYVLLDGGQVMCKLSVRFGDAWVTKCDVGGESEQPDKGDREKAAFSDALKRAAVKWGIGRYLYSMPAQWCDYDPVKKQFVGTPTVPPQFLPGRTAPQQKAEPGTQQKSGEPVKDNPQLRARHAQDFANAKTRGECDRIGANIATDLKTGLISEADRLALRSVAEQAYARVSEPAKA
jgi:hypothetical protein